MILLGFSLGMTAVSAAAAQPPPEGAAGQEAASVDDADASPLPPGIVAIVDGTSVPASRLHERLLEDRAADPATEAALRQVLDTRLIGRELERRSLVVAESSVDAKLESLAGQVAEQSGGQLTLEAALEQQGVSFEVFRDQLRFLVGLEMLARRDFGIQDANPVPQEKLNLWLAELRENAPVQTEELPEGVVAVIEPDVRITRAELGAALARVVPPEELDQLLRAIVTEELVAEALAEADLTVADEDLEREMTFREWAFDRTDRYPGVEFSRYVEATEGRTVDEVMRSENFRYQVGVKKLVRREVPVEERRGRFEAEKDSFGP